MGKFHTIEEKMCKELETIQEKYKGGAEMAEADLKRVDMLAHALKSLATYCAMKDQYEDPYEGYSETYNRPRMSGRYQQYYPPERYPRW